MTNKKTTLILTIVTSIVLFILIFSTFGKLFELLLPQIENLQYQTAEMSSQFRLALFFSLVIGLAPILLYLTWRLARIEMTTRRIFSGLIVIVFMVIGILFRQQLIKSTFKKLTNLKTQTGETIYNSFAIENLHFEYYLLGGLILGCIVSFFTLRDKKLKEF